MKNGLLGTNVSKEKKIALLKLAFDLEMNQPSGRIIQIGAVVGDVSDGSIKGEFSVLIDPQEPLCRENSLDRTRVDIPALTGISDEMIRASGVPLPVGFARFIQFAKEHGIRFSPKSEVIEPFSLWCWGSGDLWMLRRQLLSESDREEEAPFPLGRRFRDIKTIWEAYAEAVGLKIRGGLGKAIQRLGLFEFEGKAHNATVDAKNTFRIGFELMKAFHPIHKEGRPSPKATDQQPDGLPE
jgi:inhibitor of KinA sporulation pathway (predicted exonuclease)